MNVILNQPYVQHGSVKIMIFLGIYENSVRYDDVLIVLGYKFYYNKN